MNKLAWDYYQKSAGFHDAIFLPDANVSWEEAKKQAPALYKGWYELCRLNVEDRKEFSCEHWFSVLPVAAKANEGLLQFFDALDDAAVVLVQEKPKAPYFPEFVYSFKDNSSFFRGGAPCTHEATDYLKHSFNALLPRDFLAFLRIHNGFKKYTDTGIITIQEMPNSRDPKVTCDSLTVDPNALIPFYESFGQHSYQCFYSEWYPTSEMGNVFFSLQDFSISRYATGLPQETLAFPTFVDWLVFYLEEVELERQSLN